MQKTRLFAKGDSFSNPLVPAYVERIYALCDALSYHLRGQPREGVAEVLPPFVRGSACFDTKPCLTEQTQLFQLWLNGLRLKEMSSEIRNFHTYSAMRGYLATWVEMHILHCIEVKALPIASNPGDAALLALPTDLLRIILSELSIADLGRVSIACKRLRSLALEPQYWEHRDERKRKAVRLEAIYDFVATAEDEVDVCVGEDITILEETDDHGWYKIRDSKGKEGMFPSAYAWAKDLPAPARDLFDLALDARSQVLLNCAAKALPVDPPIPLLNDSLPPALRFTRAMSPILLRQYYNVLRTYELGGDENRVLPYWTFVPLILVSTAPTAHRLLIKLFVVPNLSLMTNFVQRKRIGDPFTAREEPLEYHLLKVLDKLLRLLIQPTTETVTSALSESLPTNVRAALHAVRKCDSWGALRATQLYAALESDKLELLPTLSCLQPRKAANPLPADRMAAIIGGVVRAWVECKCDPLECLIAALQSPGFEDQSDAATLMGILLAYTYNNDSARLEPMLQSPAAAKLDLGKGVAPFVARCLADLGRN